MKKNKNYIHLLGLVVLVLFSSCKEEGEYHSVTERIEAESVHYQGTSISSESLLDGLDLIEITEGDHSFLIPERKSELRSFPCIECHSGSLDVLKGTNGQKAHWDIKLEHAGAEAMNCATCHNSSNLNALQTVTASPVDFNTSYQLCIQCHFPQFEDWKGGAHGKKIAGWAEPRASLSCVNCHNPHSPGFETRWPASFNTIIVKEREEDLEH